MRETVEAILSDGQWHDMASGTMADALTPVEWFKLAWHIAVMRVEGEIEFEQDGDHMWVRLKKKAA